MIYLLQRGKVRSQVINVPEGFSDVLMDITREVLRCQPDTDCLCQFIVDFLHSKIIQCENERTATAIIDGILKSMDEIIANLGCCHIPKQKSEKLSLVMEKCFGGFLNKRRCETGIEHEYLKFNENDVIDDLINKCKFSDSELRTSRPAISAAYAKFLETYRKAKKDTKCIEALYQYFQEREQNRKRASAATKIQTFFRGYSLRKLLQKQKTSSVIPEMTGTPKDSPVDEEQFLMREMAARRIQRFLRSRYKVKHAPFEGNSFAFFSSHSVFDEHPETENIEYV